MPLFEVIIVWISAGLNRTDQDECHILKTKDGYHLPMPESSLPWRHLLKILEKVELLNAENMR